MCGQHTERIVFPENELLPFGGVVVGRRTEAPALQTLLEGQTHPRLQNFYFENCPFGAQKLDLNDWKSVNSPKAISCQAFYMWTMF